MALTRAELKLVIKEILVEILNEGLGNVQVPSRGRAPISGVAEARHAQNLRRKPEFDSRLDTPVATPISEAIKRNAGGNAVMRDILADTAVRTLPTLAGDRQLGSTSMPEGASSVGSAPGVSQIEQINGTPEEVFGEDAASRWADLAFMPSKKPA
jgi:hypothetical protein